MCLSAILGGVSAVTGMISSNSAAKAQKKAADQQLALQTRVYDDQTKNIAPWLDAGTNALGAQQFLLGLGPAPTIGGDVPQIETYQIPGSSTGTSGNALGAVAPGGFGGGNKYIGTGRDRYLNPNPQQSQPTTGYRVNGQTFATLEDAQAYANANKTGGTTYGGFQKSPGYDFQLQQGIDAIQATAAAKGGLYSGRTLQDAQTYGQDLANQDFYNYLGQVSNVSDAGQNAAAMQGTAGANYAAGGSNAFASRGNAASAGAIGTGSALMNGLQNGINLWQYQKNQTNTSPQYPGLAGLTLAGI
jgi:hypothetical protein